MPNTPTTRETVVVSCPDRSHRAHLHTRATGSAIAVALVAVMALMVGACSHGGSGNRDAASADESQRPADGVDDGEDAGPDQLTDPGVAPGTCEVVTYTSESASESQDAEICRPDEDNQRNVAVMVVHGGSGIGGSREGMRPWAEALTAEGYVVMMPEYHLFTPGSAESPVFPLPERDIKAAVQYLRGTAHALGISRKHIVVQGMSAGARIGSVAYTTPDDPSFDGPELWPDISDRVDGFIGYYHPYDGSMQYSIQYYGGPEDSRDTRVLDRWDSADAIANARAVAGPALLITGDKDWDLQITQQDELAERVRSAGHDATTLVIRGGGHGFDQSGTRLTKLGEQALTAELGWLNDQFPQKPARPAQNHAPDTRTAPDFTGSPPTTFVPRTRPSTDRYAGSGGSTGSTTTQPDTSSTTTDASTTTSSQPGGPDASSSTTTPSASTTTTAKPPTTTTPTSPATTTTAAPAAGDAAP